MTTKTYRGSCHCGRVKFEVDLDLSLGTGRCNCSICWKSRSWSTSVKPEAFRLVSGEDSLGKYTNNPAAHHEFCAHCGIRTFGRGDLPDLGGPFVSINLAALDDLDPAELIAAPLTFYNGRDDKWWEPPAETRHL